MIVLLLCFDFDEAFHRLKGLVLKSISISFSALKFIIEVILTYFFEGFANVDDFPVHKLNIQHFFKE